MANDALNAAGDNRRPSPRFSVRDALGGATRNGADAIGMGDRIGSLHARASTPT